MSDHAHMGRAAKLALEMMRSNKGGPFGAVIVRDGEVIAEGWNQVTSTNDPTAHAEITAIRAACKKLDTFVLTDCDIYTSCEPCPMCLGAIYWARLRRMYYANTREEAAVAGFDDAFIYDEIPLKPEARKIPGVKLSHPDMQIAFEEWINKPDKIRY